MKVVHLNGISVFRQFADSNSPPAYLNPYRSFRSRVQITVLADSFFCVNIFFFLESFYILLGF